MNAVSIPLTVKSSDLASVTTNTARNTAAACGNPNRRDSARSSRVAPPSAPAHIRRKSQSAAGSLLLPVSRLAAAGSRTPSGEVNVWSLSPRL